MKNYYAILEVPVESSLEEIRQMPQIVDPLRDMDRQVRARKR